MIYVYARGLCSLEVLFITSAQLRYFSTQSAESAGLFRTPESIFAWHVIWFGRTYEYKLPTVLCGWQALTHARWAP